MLKLLSKIYNYFVNKNNDKYDNNTATLHNTNAKIISIGNISAGGTGKTPLAEAIAKYLCGRDFKVAIAAKGYKGNFSGNLLVRDNHNIFCNADKCGDEMYMLAKNLNIPIAVNNQKYQAAQYLDNTFHPDFIILDDGFQHRKLHRDLDIVILDKASLDNPHTFPAGRLREPIENLRRADVICVSEDSLNSLNYPNKLIGGLKTNTLGLFDGENKINKLAESALLFSGIGNNAKFHKTCSQYGIAIKSTIEFRDHHNYRLSDIHKITAKAKKKAVNYLITTEKDIAKLYRYRSEFSNCGLTLLYLKIETEITYNREKLFDKIVKLIGK